MENNVIAITQGDTKNIRLIVHSDPSLNLDEYVCNLNVKKTAADEDILLNILGEKIEDDTYLLRFMKDDTSLNVGSYVYDIVLESSLYKYTVMKNALIIEDGVSL